MQVLGNRSKVLLIVVAVVMLVAVGVSFAAWDNMSVVRATTGNVAYATAQVGDIIQYGKYYQTGNKVSDEKDAEYEKTPIDWIVVDKDERTGQLTLMSKYILACGSYFGNYYDDGNGFGYHYNNNTSMELDGVPYNQAYIDSTARAFLNNLERFDMGGDEFDSIKGYVPSGKISTKDKTVNGQYIKGTGLLSSVGFSNQRYWTGLNTENAVALEGTPGFTKRSDLINNLQEFYYQRPIKNAEYAARPMTRGFLEEAFTSEEISLIVPKVIAGYIGHRWPRGNDVATKSYVDGTVDKVWLPSVTELNVEQGEDWNNLENDAWTNTNDKTSSTTFEYFKRFKGSDLSKVLTAERTTLASNGKAGNYSIPIYKKGTTEPIEKISENNISAYYWTRSIPSYWYEHVRVIRPNGLFSQLQTINSTVGIRPCITLKY